MKYFYFVDFFLLKCNLYIFLKLNGFIVYFKIILLISEHLKLPLFLFGKISKDFTKGF